MAGQQRHRDQSREHRDPPPVVERRPAATNGNGFTVGNVMSGEPRGWCRDHGFLVSICAITGSWL
jgi:hypothetical protein